MWRGVDARHPGPCLLAARSSCVTLAPRNNVRQVTCEYFDGITDYRWKEDDEVTQQRVEDFDSFLTSGANPNKI